MHPSHAGPCAVAQCTRTCLHAAESGTASYKVLVQTSDIRGAGTDSDIFIRLFGPKGDSGERLLDTSANDFERGNLDTFLFTVGARLRASLDTFLLTVGVLGCAQA